MLELTKQQRNVIFQIIQQNGFDPHRFTWSHRVSEWNTKTVPPESTRFIEAEIPDGAESLNITVEGKQNYFTFEDGLRDRYGAAMKPRLDGLHNVAASSWNSLLTYFAQWLSIIRLEIEEPDLWSNPPIGTALSIPVDYRNDEYFTQDERLRIGHALRAIKDRIKAQATLDHAQTLKLDNAFIYLEQKMESSSKIDWKNILIGTVISIMAEPWGAPVANTLKDFLVNIVPTFFKHLLNS